MPTVFASPFGPKMQRVLSTGLPAVGNKLFFYVAGSVNTKQDTYTDSTGTVANTNPIVLDSLGQIPLECWFTQGQSYKVVYAPSTDTDPPTSPIWTIDNLDGINDVSLTYSEWTATGLTPTFIGATQFSVSGNQTSVFQVGRRIRFTDGSGTNYGTVSNSVYTPPAPDLTTVTVTVDSGGVIDAGIANLDVSILTATSPSVPQIITGSTGAVVTYTNGKPNITAPGTLISNTLYGVVSGATVTMTIASPCVVTLPAGQSLAEGMPIVFTTTGSLPTGITAGTMYYVSGTMTGSNPSTFNVSATLGGANINTSGGQSGVHSANNPTYNKATNNPSYIEIECVGGGGGGGGVTAVAGAAASGGGAGGWAMARIPNASIVSGAVTLTIGAGGAGGTTAGTNGTAGTNTAALIMTGSTAITGLGGSGGVGSTAASTARAGGDGGGNGTPGVGPGSFIAGANYFGCKGSPGGSSISTAAAASSAAGAGGSSRYGAGALAPAGATSAGANGIAIGAATTYNPGAGGSGAMGATANAGGIGAPGLIIIREYS